MHKDDTCLHLPDKKIHADEFIDKQSQIYHALMPFKVREILIVSSLYDAFVIEEEGLISELVIGQYQHHLLSSPPRVTRVYSGAKALKKVKDQHFDLVITMPKHIGMDPFEFGKAIKKECPDLPVLLLATDTTDVRIIEQRQRKKGIDKTFFWTGDSALFLALIKYVEDKINAQYDTKNGNTRVLIMVEDSIRFYSMFLPIMYTEIVQQTRRSISEDLNEMQRLLRRRARPKILLAETYEEALGLYEQFKEYTLGIISDIHFPRNNKLDENAGYDLIKKIKEDQPYLPILLQSTVPENRKKAEKLDANFLDKNSQTLIQDFQHFVLGHLGFGDFKFLKPKGKMKGKPIKNLGLHDQTIQIAHAGNMHEFEYIIKKVPLESIRFHADRNDFSNWLMARCEFKLAMVLRPKKVSEFKDLDEVRKHLISVFNETRREKQNSVITDFNNQQFEFENTFTRLHGDSLGGKGRGIAFIRTLLDRYNLNGKYPNINIIVPSTVVIGTLEFDRFINENNLQRFRDRKDYTDEQIAQAFLKGSLNQELKENLDRILRHFTTPLAIRSSSLLEDSLSHPFAGLYRTYMLPNNHPHRKKRLEQLCQAIKLVFASVYYEEPRVYIESTAAKIDEEKMAVIIQELVGSEINGYYYPTISGVAQSYNFYPVSHQTYEDGITNVAVGLGKTVVGGEIVLRFSPKHPEIIPEYSTAEEILKNSQREMYVLNMIKKEFQLLERDDITLKKINIADIRNDEGLSFIASTYDHNDRMIRDELSDDGPLLITFAGILKYNQFPLAPLLEDILAIGQQGMGCPIEIEFAINFDQQNTNPPTFAVLQIRPLVPSKEICEFSITEDVPEKTILMRSMKALGNGVINNIKDIVYIPPDTFDSAKTIEIAEEIGSINKKMSSKKPYILIGPGRWGTQDRWLGIPVKWNHISHVKIMVETALESFNIKPSQGTHFFQNLISKGIGYINITLNKNESMIDWNWLNKIKPQQSLKYVRHIHLNKPIKVTLDGRCGSALVVKPE